MLLLNATDSAFNRSNFPSKLFDYLSAGKLIVCTANPLLADYAGLGCVVQLASIEDEFPHIGERLAERRFDPGEVVALHRGMLERLGAVLDAATGGPAPARFAGRRIGPEGPSTGWRPAAASPAIRAVRPAGAPPSRLRRR